MIIPALKREDLVTDVEGDEVVLNWFNNRDPTWYEWRVLEQPPASQDIEEYWLSNHSPYLGDEGAGARAGPEQVPILTLTAEEGMMSTLSAVEDGNVYGAGCQGIQQGDRFWEMMEVFVGLNQLLICLTAGLILGFILSRYCCKKKPAGGAQPPAEGVGNAVAPAPEVIQANDQNLHLSAPSGMVLNMESRRGSTNDSTSSSSSSERVLTRSRSARERDRVVISRSRENPAARARRNRRWRETSSRIRAEVSQAGVPGIPSAGGRLRARVTPTSPLLSTISRGHRIIGALGSPGGIIVPTHSGNRSSGRIGIGMLSGLSTGHFNPANGARPEVRLLSNFQNMLHNSAATSRQRRSRLAQSALASTP